MLKMAKKKSAKKIASTPVVVYKAHTDGSALNNPGPGGYGAVVRCGDLEVTLSKGYFLTTNNRMEIMSVIAVLEEFGPEQHFEIYSDSQYTIDGATKWTKGWIRNNWIAWKTGQAIKNQDLWKILHELLKVNDVKFFKVKAHSGIPDNELADKLAKEAAGSPTTHDSEYSGIS